MSKRTLLILGIILGLALLFLAAQNEGARTRGPSQINKSSVATALVR